MTFDSKNHQTIPKILGILGCTKKKIWDQNPDIGPVPARSAYCGDKFISDHKKVEALTTRWIILSAKYGFIDPDFIIPQKYDVTFNPNYKSDEPPVSNDKLIQQIKDLGLDSFDTVRFFSSCGDLYEAKTREAFANISIRFEKI